MLDPRDFHRFSQGIFSECTIVPMVIIDDGWSQSPNWSAAIYGRCPYFKMLCNQGCWINWLHSRHSRDGNFCYWIKMQLNCLFMSKETRSNGKSWQWHKEIKYERSILIFIWKNLFKYVTVSAHIVWHVPKKEINFLFKCKLLRNDKYLISIPIFFVLSRMI